MTRHRPLALLALLLLASQLSCAKGADSAAPATGRYLTKAAEAPPSMHEITIEEKEEAAEPREEAKAEPPPEPSPEPVAAAAPVQDLPSGGLGLRGVGEGGGGIGNARFGGKGGAGAFAPGSPSPSAAAPPPPPPDSNMDQAARRRQARAVVAKKAIAGAFMEQGARTKLFAEGDEADGETLAKDMGIAGASPSGDNGGSGASGELVFRAGFDKQKKTRDSREGLGGLVDGKLRPKPAPRKPRIHARNKADSSLDDGVLDLSRGGERRDEDGDGRAVQDTSGLDEDEAEPEEVPERRPERFLPRMCYFENTYLGGNAAYVERLRRLDEAFGGDDRVYRQARAAVADLDPPPVSGLALSANLSRRSLSQPGRVFLEIGLRGSRRYGWRRPPLDIAVVIDGPALQAAPDVVAESLLRLVRKLGPQDRVFAVRVGAAGPEVVLEAAAATEMRFGLASKLEALGAAEQDGGGHLDAAMDLAGAELGRMGANTHRIPGSRIALLLVDGRRTDRVRAAMDAAHRLTLQGAVTSVLAVGTEPTSSEQGWWQVANAGHGSYRFVAAGAEDAAVQAELEALSRVVARLIRVNIRLGKHTQAIRVIGAKVLGQQEVQAVKAREKVVDQKLSETMGVSADRGDDDDGIQTVIPYFLGDDSHVILVELWVDEPGQIAEVSLRYKDLVTLGNATARVGVALARFERKDTAVQRLVRRAAREAELAELLGKAAEDVRNGAYDQATQTLQQAHGQTRDRDKRALLGGFNTLVIKEARRSPARRALVIEALEVAKQRQLGD